MSDDQRFSYQGRVYSVKTLDELSLDDLILFEQETADAGRPMTIADAEKLPDNSAMAMAIGVWATMRAAGDSITFAEARKIRLKDLQAVAAPTDRKVKADPKAKKPRSSPSTDGSTPARNDEQPPQPTIRSVAS